MYYLEVGVSVLAGSKMYVSPVFLPPFLSTYVSKAMYSLLYIKNVVHIPPSALYSSIAHYFPPLCVRLLSPIMGFALWVRVDGELIFG